MAAIDEWDQSKNDPLYGFVRANLSAREQFAVRVSDDGTALVSISKNTLKGFHDRYARASHTGCMWSLSREAIEAVIAAHGAAK